MPTLFIHVGTHKTGSTAIQEVLRKSKSALASEQIRYIPFSLLIPSAPALETARELSNSAVASDRKRITEQLKSCTANGSIVTSWEGFSGDPYDGHKNAGIVAEHLRKITRDEDTRILLYVRRQDSYVESIYTQSIHEGRTWDFSDFLDRFDDASFDWSALANQFAERFSSKNLIVRSYDPVHLPDRSSLVQCFAADIGSQSLTSIQLSNAPNAGLSRDALEVLRECNQTLAKEDRHRLRFLLQAEFAKEPFGDYGYFSADARAQFLAMYDAANARLRKDHFADLDTEVFSQPNINEAPAYAGLTTSAACTILAAIAVRQNELVEATRESGIAHKTARHIWRAAKRVLGR